MTRLELTAKFAFHAYNAVFWVPIQQTVFNARGIERNQVKLFFSYSESDE